ncbi:MAG: response regulator transcription factor [Nocardioides marinisabuli]|uniref:response regulator transcription factor n=1 Tax=Nocardioides marinisabuli TaxID=419476 RepID=UPI00321A0C61
MLARAQARGDQARSRVLVVDDHRTFTDLTSLALATEDDLQCVGTATDSARARRLVEQHHPDVVLMDVNLGGEDGLVLTEELLRLRPTLRVVVLTAYADLGVLRRAAAAGACALLPKNGSLPELLEVLRTARPGGLVVHPSLLRRLVGESGGATASASPVPRLTARERAVLDRLAQGHDVRWIARDLDITVNTCRGYVKSLLAKLDAHSQLEAVVAATAHGLLHGPGPG